jgi:cellulose synthase/poly-beta-1,6-N-acetylglucosamine synthase-like glycosyltransferase
VNILSLCILVVFLIPLGYLLLLALASIRRPPPPTLSHRQPSIRFAITIPAHDEEAVIEATVQRLRALDYPTDLFNIHVVADHCSDSTAALARSAGAIVYERDTGPRSGKGAALNWLFEQIMARDDCDAIVVFDSDTQVDSMFLRVMDARLAQGEQVVQGQHVISNPESGWFPALTWAMFLVDNRYGNLGRTNLGWSAKHMGDSICFRTEVLWNVGGGEGLTEDYQLRQQLLLQNVKIAYEPAAIGYGEAPRTWAQAQAQRARWLRGTHDASQQYGKRLLKAGIQRRDGAVLDGALQAHLPSYSTLTMAGVFCLLVQLCINELAGPVFSAAIVWVWAVAVAVLFCYPFLGLALERAPLRAYAVILSGPFYIVWRTWLALKARLFRKQVTWVRTTHGEQQ